MQPVGASSSTEFAPQYGESPERLATVASIYEAMPQEFIEQRRGGYYFVGSHVPLESVVYQFLQGESPEGIVQPFPSLSLLQAYGGITCYLAGRG
jgi:uncharacterized protein (DUF433 family)